LPEPMGTPDRLRLYFKALTQLPPRQTIQFARYKVGLAAGWYRRQTLNPPTLPAGLTPQQALPQPTLTQIASLLGSRGLQALQDRARSIQAGQLPVFNSFLNRESLAPPPPQRHWTELEGRSPELLAQDIKLIWEPARFVWALALGQAAALTGDSGYASSLWDYLDLFEGANPPYLGWNWISAQEAALRLVTVAASWQWIATTLPVPPERQVRVARWIATHAGRISPTLAYSRAQNNNHLLSEAAGLYTAGCFLPGHPAAKRWRDLGWSWFHRGMLSQIQADGSYTQHSTNYHRLVLQLALWVFALSLQQKQSFPVEVLERLAAAARWLLALTDPACGRVPGLGPNDGADLFPLSLTPFADFRPVLNAAGRAFLGENLFPAPANESLALWLLGEAPIPPRKDPPSPSGPPSPPSALLHLEHPDHHSWAYLRAVRFSSRPGHADQLHLDLWWQGHNLALDPGTYRYNDLPPWDNALVHTAVHNTLTINGEDQMAPAGRFLFLDWAQAEVEQVTWGEAGQPHRVFARHSGYRRFGITHRRALTAAPGGPWEVQDQLLADEPQPAGSPLAARLHWLLPDAPWRLADPGPGVQHAFQIEVAGAWITLQLSLNSPGGDGSSSEGDFQVYRAGEILVGSGPPAQPGAGPHPSTTRR
jgi:hypothetical protein